MGVLAGVAVALSALNLSVAITVAAGAMICSLILAWHEWRRPSQVLLLGDIGQPATLIENGVESIVTLQRIGFRGNFVQLDWLTGGGKGACRALWPDALPESQRRALRRRYGTGGDAVAATMAG